MSQFLTNWHFLSGAYCTLFCFFGLCVCVCVRVFLNVQWSNPPIRRRLPPRIWYGEKSGLITERGTRH